MKTAQGVKRRTVLLSGLGLAIGSPMLAEMNQSKLEAAADLLEQNTDSGSIEAAAIYVRHQQAIFARSFGAAKSKDAIFLLASISKPISIAAVMTLFDQGAFKLDDPVNKFIPELAGDGRDQITMGHLMTHRCGLPDQLPENAELRARHAPLRDFMKATVVTPLLFAPGSRYSYSSMGILLASEVAQRITGKPFASLVDESVYQPLEMKASALGRGSLDRGSLMRCQVEHAAKESGAGDPSSKDWDWNSSYWRELGSPWGGAHGSATDVARFLDAFLHPQGRLLKPETARLMISNHNPPGLRPRGLGFDLGTKLGGSATSSTTFGHGGSTGTLCWADPKTDTVFIVLTTLPARAVKEHPRDITSRMVAQAVG